jgi:hypothetical protein
MQSHASPPRSPTAVDRAQVLCRHSVHLIAEARTVQSLAAWERRRSSLRRRTRLAAGSSDARESPPLTDVVWRQAIRSKLRVGRLPATRCTSSFSGTGRSGQCDGCDLPITPEQVEIGARFRDRHTLRFHARCFRCWYAEAAASA